MRRIAHTEGVIRGFYRGWTVSLMLYAPYRCTTRCYACLTPVQLLVVGGVRSSQGSVTDLLSASEAAAHGPCRLWCTLQRARPSLLLAGHCCVRVCCAHELRRGGENQLAGGHVRTWSAAHNPLCAAAPVARGGDPSAGKGLRSAGDERGTLVVTYYTRLRSGKAACM